MSDFLPNLERNVARLGQLSHLPIEPLGGKDGESYVVTLELDVQLPPEYMGLTVDQKSIVRRTFLRELTSDGKSRDRFERLSLAWERCPLDFDDRKPGDPLTLAHVHKILSTHLETYNRETWKPAHPERGAVIPPSVAEFGSPQASQTQYVWRHGKFVCIQLVQLFEDQPQPLQMQRAWSFGADLPGGRRIRSRNQAIISWSIL